jgi:hypothetical protein
MAPCTHIRTLLGVPFLLCVCVKGFFFFERERVYLLPGQGRRRFAQIRSGSTLKNIALGKMQSKYANGPAQLKLP